MSDYQVMVDRHRHTFLRYRDNGKSQHFVTMIDGTIDTVQMPRNEYSQLKPHSCSPLHFAEKYLGSFLTISRSARAILGGILGETPAPEPVARPASFTSATVSLAQILEGTGIEVGVARKHLRKLVDKPGGRWEWPQEEAPRILSLIQEMGK